MDIIDVSPDDLVLSGDCLGGAVLYENYAWTIPQTALTDSPAGTHPGIKVMHPGSRDRLRRVLAAGEPCGCWHGLVGTRGPQGEPDAEGCPDCGGKGADAGTGYTRPPHDIGHFIDAEIAGRITPLAAAGLMWASVLRVEAGLGPVVGWDDLYQNNTDACSVERWCNARTWWTHGPEQRDYFTAPSGTGHLGWEWGTFRGMETGEAAADCLNRTALSAGFALLNDDHILLPLPDRIARLRLEG